MSLHRRHPVDTPRRVEKIPPIELPALESSYEETHNGHAADLREYELDAKLVRVRGGEPVVEDYQVDFCEPVGYDVDIFAGY